MTHTKRCLSVVVTRPEPAAQMWQTELERYLPFVQVHKLPLIDISAISDPAAIGQLRCLWQTAQQFYAVAFVSRFAVEHFFALTEISSEQFNLMCMRVWAVGQGTREALLQVGLSPSLIDAPPKEAQQFDSDALWQQVNFQVEAQKDRARSVLIVRGLDDTSVQPYPQKNNQLENVLNAKKVAYKRVFVYQRKLPVWDEQQQKLVSRLLNENSVWLFSSSVAVLHLARLAPQVTVKQWRKQQVIATHKRIAQAAAQLGFCNIQLCRPVLDDVVRCIVT